MRTSTLSILFALAACGSGSPHAPPDAAIDAAPDASDAPGTCRVDVDVGSVVMEMRVATAIPAPQGGGPIPDGTYKLTAVTYYTGTGGASGPTGQMESSTSYLKSGLSHVVTTTNGRATFNDYTVATNGTVVTIAQTCPTQSALGFDGYTSNAGVVTFYDSHIPASREYTLIP